jgi:hypothetical protein
MNSIGGYSNNPCVSGHVFIFVGGSSYDKVPEGYLCSCGRYKAHWIKCPTCGQDKLEVVEVK